LLPERKLTKHSIIIVSKFVSTGGWGNFSAIKGEFSLTITEIENEIKKRFEEALAK